MDKIELAKQLETIARSLSSVINTLREEIPTPPISTPSEAKRRAEAGICTFCGKPLPEVDEGRADDRGAHKNTCYKQIQRQIKDGVISKEDAVAWGWLLPAKTGGRPPKAGSAAHRVMELDLAKKKRPKP